MNTLPLRDTDRHTAQHQTRRMGRYGLHKGSATVARLESPSPWMASFVLEYREGLKVYLAFAQSLTKKEIKNERDRRTAQQPTRRIGHYGPSKEQPTFAN